MAKDMFLKLDGCEGESSDAVHAKEIDILAWSFGATNSGTHETGGGGGAGKTNVQDLSITKNVDSSTHILFQKAFDGSHIASATLTVRKAAGKGPLEYMIIRMKHILVTSISTGGSGAGNGDDVLTENVTLNFAEVEIDYTPQTDDGAAGAVKKAGWNIQGNCTLV